ncbi:hypothetical protein B4586_03315 [Lacticaseibacillus paracasei]|nr:hypothetical protein B4586_03315 [Lacticaseibacillus paracasei]
MTIRRRVSWLIRSPARLHVVYRIDDFTNNLKIRRMLNILLIPVGILNLVRLKLMTRSPEKFMYQLSIVTTVKNEAPYLREWLRYHISVGVQHFYLYDNDSQDNLDEVLKDFSDYVTLTKIHGRVRQFDAYNDAINRFRYETKYMAVIDADEFIFRPGKGKLLLPLIDYLLSNKSFGGVAVNWAIFGSSGLKKKPLGLVTDNFVYRANDNFRKNRLVKTICNPRKVFYFSVSHAANYLPGFYAVNENQEKVDWTTTQVPSISKIRINHYYSKSQEEFLRKRARGAGDVVGFRDLGEFAEHDRNDVFDDSLRVYNESRGLNKD